MPIGLDEDEIVHGQRGGVDTFKRGQCFGSGKNIRSGETQRADGEAVGQADEIDPIFEILNGVGAFAGSENEGVRSVAAV